MPIQITFLRDTEHGGQPNQPDQVASLLSSFIQQAQKSLHIAVYDFRLNPNSRYYQSIVGALKDRAAAGVEVLIAYDHGKPEQPRPGTDPAPSGTHFFLQQAFSGTPIQCKAITELHPYYEDSKLMHNKFLIRDGAAVWTGSVNLTEDAWTFMENNILEIDSPELAALYESDFQQLWTSGDIDASGDNDSGMVTVGQAIIEVAFSPGEGPTIASHMARLIASAHRRIKIASMLIASHEVLGVLQDAIHHNQVPELNGIYDSTQMQETIQNWQRVPSNQRFISIFEEVTRGFSSKASLPYSPSGKHNFMHDKILVCDDSVFTGSFNFSHSATQNAENALILHDKTIADQYADYIDQLTAAYKSA